MLNTASIVDNYINRLNNISDILNKLKKNFNNRNISIINKFYDLHSRKERKLFLSNSFDCTCSLNNNLTVSNNIANSF